MNAKSIYIHIPFCKTKCPYCDFASYVSNQPANSQLLRYADLSESSLTAQSTPVLRDLQASHLENFQTNLSLKKNKYEEYTDALINEIRYRLPKKDKTLISTVFFGGGTPSLHSKEEYQEIFKTLQEYFIFSDDMEITLEANPGTIDRNKLSELIEAGINRISIGVQTFDEVLLQKLGRGHSVEDSYQAIEDLKSLDLKSWSFDLIYGLPGQTIESWEATVDKALSFNPPHISAYALSIEEATPYGKIYKDSKHPDLPVEEAVVEMYNLAHKKFKEAGLERYEISNWAKPGDEAKHNLTYWYAEEYYAFGLSAHGYIDSCRYANTRDLKSYLESFSEAQNNLTSNFNFDHCVENNLIPEDEKLEEKIILNLRLNTGLEINEGIKHKINFESLEKLKTDGYLVDIAETIFLTDKAILVSNKVINQLVK